MDIKNHSAVGAAGPTTPMSVEQKKEQLSLMSLGIQSIAAQTFQKQLISSKTSLAGRATLKTTPNNLYKHIMLVNKTS